MDAESRLIGPRPGPTLLLFGPLALSFDAAAFAHLRKTAAESDHSWMLEVVAELPQCWDAVAAAIGVRGGAGREKLEDLQVAFQTGRPLETAFPLPNKMLVPLVVMAQLLQYAAFLRRTSAETDGRVDPFAAAAARTSGMETLGFCTGLLSAFAVSSAGSAKQFAQYCAVAVKLGMVAGMVADGDLGGTSTEMEAYRAIGTEWDSAEGLEEMMGMLKEFPEAYISVNYDHNRATVTTTSSTAATLQRHLRSSGIAASEISLFGRYHTRDHSAILARLLSFCDSHAAFQLPDASQASVPARSNRDGAIIVSGPLHHHALRSILVDRPEWAASLRAASQDVLLDEGPGLAVCFGAERCVPPSLVRDLGSRAVHLADLADPDLALSGRGERGERRRRHFAETDVAVVGMACKAAGADDLESFWEVLGSGQSQHREVPPERFGFDTAFRAADAKRRWFGNFVDGHDAFDHKFFRASARESATTDPQQRLMLQVAYQAVEQSGYFQRTRQAGDRRVGCYVGICGTDYEHNIACQPANAFCATGNLEGFAAGKISHHFGWTGPAMVVDTACSSSAVAIHQACRSIIAGECTAALAGGSHIMTSPLRFQNLAGASFLSLTGQCKPFDSRADGYCRGEGVAAVFLKKASVAVADGDMILGVIAATAVQQNRSCTPIFVPNSPSLSDLFREVLQRARVRPEQVSVVEAHGTGTAVGDPVEYRSVREVMGGPARRAAGELVLGSVKGSIGHTEPVSGVLSLVKVLLMMQRRMVLPQASFEVLNPAIEASPADRIVIPTKARHWEGDDAGFRAALINNYGASGSNASMVVTQPPARVAQAATALTGALPGLGSKHPFWLCGNDKATLRRYAGVLRQFLARHRSQGDTYSSDDLSPANVAFNLARQSNRLLGHGVVFSVRSADELERKLASVEQGDGADAIVAAGATARPVVLCFGGQVSTFVGLDREVYSRVAVLRHHLDTVDAVVRGLGAASIYPGIFERKPQVDPVALQTMLFALQFACARSWIDAGLEPVAVVGHSFGELTALCVSQTVSLEDVVRAIVGRAKLVRERWGADRGAMVAVEGDRAEVERLLAEAAREIGEEVQPATVACYNGPRSFTLAGPTAAIQVVLRVLERRPAAYPGLRSKLLRVTHAFHCGLVDPLVPGLEECGGGLTFREPKIPMERATEEEAEGKPSGGFLAAHMRLPVFFNHALQRISNKHPGCVFLEAGSGSTVAAMAGRALNTHTNNNEKQHFFQGLDVTSVPGSGWNNLVDATTNLWKAGVRVHFWAHQGRQTSQQNPSLPLVLLPPYQFEKSRHWVELKTPPKPGNLPTVCSSCSQAAKAEKKEEEEEQLVRFIGYRSKDGSDRGPVAQFVIDTAGKEYGRLVSGHVFASTAPICPATVQLDFVIEALRGLRPELARLEPRLQGVQCQSPVCVDPARTLWIELEEAAGAAATAAEPGRWEFRVFSTDGAGTATVHTTGAVVLWRAGDATAALEIARLERLVGGLARCEAVLRGGEEGDEVLQSRSIYKIFADVVDYTGDYRGVQRLVGREDVSAGFVSRRAAATTWFDACLADCFCQVAGIWANCMTDQAAADMFVCNGIEQWVRNPAALAEGGRPKAFRVLARHHRVSAKAFLSDVFAFDADTGALVDVVTGISYVRVARASMSKLLVRMSAPSAVVGGQGVGPVAAAAIPAPLAAAATTATTTTTSTNPVSATATPPPPPTPPSHSPKPVASSKSSAKAPGPPNVAPKVKAILAELTGIEPDEIQADSQLANLGVDSLLGMEMAHEIESAFGICLPESELLEITDVPGLVRCVQNAVARKGGDSTAGDIADGEKEEEQDEVDDSSSSDAGTPSQSCSSGVQTGLSTPLPVSEIGAGGKIDSRPTGIGCGNNSSDDLHLSVGAVMDAFDQTKRMTDARIAEYGQDRYADEANPLQTRLCAALILEAFEDLGCPLGPPRTAGQEPPKLIRVPHGREHSRLVDALYAMLERDEAGHLVAVDGCSIARTSEPLPTEPSTALFQQLQTQFPDQATANELILYAGSRLADVLRGRTDGIKLIFGCAEGRATVSRFYADWPLHRLLYRQAEDFLGRLAEQVRGASGTLRILEMGAGTGGTTRWLLPVLARAGVPVEYTFTDLAPSLVAAARKRFTAEYPFMRFQAHDIEKEPLEQLIGTQHVVVASNAVHATHNLRTSLANMRKALRPDGLLLLVEMTGRVWWMDLVFGLFEGWWFFDDSRSYVISDERAWEADLRAVGYGCVAWTDGARPENKMERLIVATASDNPLTKCAGFSSSPLPPLSFPSPSSPSPSSVAASNDKSLPAADCDARQAVVDRYVRDLTDGFSASMDDAIARRFGTKSRPRLLGPGGACVLVTGATGSLGSHLVAELALRPGVRRVVCLNRARRGRHGDEDPWERQRQAFATRAIVLPDHAAAKLTVLETDLSKPRLGLAGDQYDALVGDATHIVHNAWLMNTKWPLIRFEPQLRIMRCMIDLARDVAACRPQDGEGTAAATFQFVSSIAAVGHWPLHTGRPTVPEERMAPDSALPIGYGVAKHICERMLDETLHHPRHAAEFRAMVVRLGQIAGSCRTGYWNPAEHLPFLVRSSQTLGAMPALDGHLSWTPIDAVAATLADLLLRPGRAHPIYHIDNPIRQPWPDMVRLLADSLGLQSRSEAVIPFTDWLRRLRDHPARGKAGENPAALLADFFDRDFVHMSCGALVLGTAKACNHSPTLANLGVVTDETVKLFVKRWRDTGFLD